MLIYVQAPCSKINAHANHICILFKYRSKWGHIHFATHTHTFMAVAVRVAHILKLDIQLSVCFISTSQAMALLLHQALFMPHIFYGIGKRIHLPAISFA